MLSRHAEALFWMGRYVERAEETARMLDVTYHNLLESPPEEEATAWRELLEVLHLDRMFGDGEAVAAAVSHYLVTDDTNPGSIVSAVGHARENAYGVRDSISTELWEAMNRVYLELRAMDLDADLERRPYEVFRRVKERCQLISGVVTETLPRDDGYRFISLGAMLERAEMTCRLLAVRYARIVSTGRPMGFHVWLAVLKSVSAFEAYLKSNAASFDSTKVLEFLLLSPDFPRSVLFSLRRAERQLNHLLGSGDRAGVLRVIGRVRARTEYCDISEVVDSGLDQFLESLQLDIYEVANTVTDHFFRASADSALHAYEAI